MITQIQYVFLVLIVIGCSRANTDQPHILHEASRMFEPQVYDFVDSHRSRITVNIYPENEIWYVQKNRISSDGYPDLLERRHFSHYEAAYNFARLEWGVSDEHRLTDPWTGPAVESRAGESLWKALRQWTWQDELALAKWIQNNFKPDFFVSLGIANDCADVAYQLRMIYAREHGLPVAFRLSSGGAWFTHNTMRAEWKKLKTDPDWRKDKRFLKAIDYVANQTYTHTLARDVYPIEISPASMIEGTIHLSLTENTGHTMIAHEVYPQGSDPSRLPLYVLYSNVPKIVRPLYETFFFNSEQPQKSNKGYTGFVRFRWPKTLNSAALLEPKELPYFSEEQYAPEFVSNDANFSIAVFKKINPLFEPSLRVIEGVKALKNMISDRKKVVTDGYAICQKGCKEGSVDYEDWSTPSRDKRIRDLFLDLEKYVYMMTSYPLVAAEWQKAQEEVVLEYQSRNYKLKNLFWTFKHAYFGSDPNLEPAWRWGIEPQIIAQMDLQKIQALLIERERILGLNKCQSLKCSLFDKDFFLNSTAFIDGQLKQAIPSDYCLVADKDFCDDYERELVALPSGSPHFSSGLHVIKSLDQFNFDPRLPSDKSWGGSKSYSSLQFDYGAEVVSHTDSLVLVAEFKSDSTWGRVAHKIHWIDYQQKKLISTYDCSDLMIHSLAMNPDGSVIAFSRKFIKVTLFNFPDQTLQHVEVSSPVGADPKNYYFQIKWHGAQSWSYETADGVWIFHLQNKQWVMVRYLPGFTTSDLVAFRILPPHQIDILFLQNTLLSQKTYDLNTYFSSDDLRSCTFEALPSSRLLGTCFGGVDHKPQGNFILDVQSQKIQAPPKNWPKSGSIFNNMIVETLEQSTSFYAFDADLKITDSKVAPMSSYKMDDNFLLIKNDLWLLNKQTHQFEKILEVTDDVQVLNLFDQYMVLTSFQADSSQSTLIDMSTGEPVVSAHSMSIEKHFSPFYPWLYVGWQYVGTLDQTTYLKFFEARLNLLDLDQPAVMTSAFVSPTAPQSWTAKEIQMMSTKHLRIKKLVKRVDPTQQQRPLQWLRRGSKVEMIFR